MKVQHAGLTAVALAAILSLPAFAQGTAGTGTGGGVAGAAGASGTGVGITGDDARSPAPPKDDFPGASRARALRGAPGGSPPSRSTRWSTSRACSDAGRSEAAGGDRSDATAARAGCDVAAAGWSGHRPLGIRAPLRCMGERRPDGDRHVRAACLRPGTPVCRGGRIDGAECGSRGVAGASPSRKEHHGLRGSSRPPDRDDKPERRPPGREACARHEWCRAAGRDRCSDGGASHPTGRWRSRSPAASGLPSARGGAPERCGNARRDGRGVRCRQSSRVCEAAPPDAFCAAGLAGPRRAHRSVHRPRRGAREWTRGLCSRRNETMRDPLWFRAQAGQSTSHCIGNKGGPGFLLASQACAGGARSHRGERAVWNRGRPRCGAGPRSVLAHPV